MRWNARRRFEAIQPHLAGGSLLDVGSAEGWIGECVAKKTDMQVELVDVIPINRSKLPFQLYDGRQLPFPDQHFDTVTLLLTLHHCSSPEAVLAEAIRVACKRVIVTESVYHTRLGLKLLQRLDSGFNNPRSGSVMPPALHLKTAAEWRQLFSGYPVDLQHESWLSRGLHQQRLFVLDLADTAPVTAGQARR